MNSSSFTRRPQSKILADLPSAQQDEFLEWLIRGITYRTIQERLVTRFGVKVSLGSISGFYQTFVAPVVEPRGEKIARLVRRKLEQQRGMDETAKPS